MLPKRIHALGLVSLLALAGACEIDRPPALRESMAPRMVGEVERDGRKEPVAERMAARTVAERPGVAGTVLVASGATPGAAASVLDAQSDGPAADGDAPGAGTGLGGAPPAHQGPSADDDSPVPPATADTPLRPARERFPRPRSIRGLYVNAWAAGSSARMEDLLRIARQTEVNTLVIDIKDASGYISHRTKVPLAHEIGATGEIRIRDLPALLERLEREGIYPIARIVLVKDPILAKFRPELAVNDTAGGVWVDSKGLVWMNPYSRELWDYHLALAREVALLGFPEIQYDYVRFPDAPEEDLARAVYRGADQRSKPAVIRDLLRHAREDLAEIDVLLTADVFGVTTSARRDVGIGQVWESFIDAVDAALPMVYPSHYWQGSFGFTAPNAHPYEIVHRALRDALGRSAVVEGAGRTIPWLQDFSLGQPPYTAAEVRAQIQATYDAGIDEWILWNPGSRYTELALQPVQGFDEEPYIRVANRMVPVSERWAVLDSAAVARVRADSLRSVARQDSARAAARPADGVGSGATLD